jgi:hypothetical protein
MPDEKKTWWEQWGKIATVCMVTGALIAGMVTAGMRLSRLESRAEKVDDILQAMQQLREVLIKNGIKWDPSEFPPIAPVAMRPQGRTLEQLDAWMKYCQGMIIAHDRAVQDIRHQLIRLENKVSPFPLVPRPPSLLDFPPPPAPTEEPVDAGPDSQ